MIRRLFYLFVCLGLLFLAWPVAPAHALPGPSRYFPETGHTVSGGFLEFYDCYGGALIFGLPITEEIYEGGTTVQYFEKARFEWHSQTYTVRLGSLGLMLYGQNDPPVPDTTLPGQPDQRYFPETGHIVRGLFLQFFDTQGGLEVFGQPITEEFETQGVIVQYFERARMEIYPHRPDWVYLGNLGSEWLNKNPLYLPEPSTPPGRYFAATGYNVMTEFLEFYDKYHGERLLGNPISEEFVLDGIRQQYFENGRLEWHPEDPTGATVKPGPVGREVYGGIDLPQKDWTTPWNVNQVYFEETGHVVSNAFLEFYDAYGGPFIFGPPISEAQTEGGRIVQYFRNFKMEWYPEKPEAYRVQLAPLGVLVYRDSGRGQGAPNYYFGKVWEDNSRVRQGLGGPVGGLTEVMLTEQYFENGQMIWRHDNNKIYVLYRGGYWEAFDNPWREGDLESRGTQPPPDLVEPVRSLGKIWWRLGGPDSNLGWALGPELTYQGSYQTMERGLMIHGYDEDKFEYYRDDDDGWIYALYNNGSWEIYQDLWSKSYPHPHQPGPPADP